MLEPKMTADGVPFVRTPESAFADLPDYAFTAKYLQFEGLQLHFIDEGPRHGPVALLMHGMPTWSFLNRHIIKALVNAGWRCVAADHIGFGRSDKVIDEAWYSIAKHTWAHRQLIEHLDLTNVTLFCQDWGGPIGLAQAADTPERFSRLVIMNTWMHHAGYNYTSALRDWNSRWKPGGMFDLFVPERLSIGSLMMVACDFVTQTQLRSHIETGLPLDVSAEREQIQRAYSAPFEGLGRVGVAGPRRFPLSLPFDKPEGGDAEAQDRRFNSLRGWTKPIHFIWGSKDYVFTEDWGRAWAALFGQSTFDLLPDAGHFLQETHGREIARIFLDRLT